MIKRKVLDEVGLLDERFSPGTFEDNDYGFRIREKGYGVVLCKNSFIWHYGSGNGKNIDKWNNLARINCEKLKEKWGFDGTYFSWERKQIIDKIEAAQDDSIRVLEIGCALGATLLGIKRRFPNANVYGVELNEKVAALASAYLPIIQGDAETITFPYRKASFNYIICGDVIEHLRDPYAFIDKIKEYLLPGGIIIASIPNVQHVSIVRQLIHGKYEYADSGLLDYTHLHMFTFESIISMFRNAGMNVYNVDQLIFDEMLTDEDRKYIDIFLSLAPEMNEEKFTTYQYVVSARKI